MVKDDFDIRAFYESVKAAGMTGEIYQFNSLASTCQYRLAYDETRKHVSVGERVLDWGSGSGHFSLFLLEQGLQTVGYSFGAEPEFLRGRAGYEFVAADPDEPKRLPFPDRSFDHVFSVGVLEHVRETGGDEHASLAEIRRVLRPGGKFLCFHFPNRYTWIEPTKKLLAQRRPASSQTYAARGQYDPHMKQYFGHRFKYVEADIRKLAGDTGFDLLEVGRYNFLPRNELKGVLGNAADNPTVVGVVNAADSVMTFVLPFLCQNYFWIGRRPTDS